MFPAVSRATSEGPYNLADVAGPPSPEYPSSSVPATVVTAPVPWVALNSLWVFTPSTKIKNVRYTINQLVSYLVGWLIGKLLFAMDGHDDDGHNTWQVRTGYPGLRMTQTVRKVTQHQMSKSTLTPVIYCPDQTSCRQQVIFRYMRMDVIIALLRGSLCCKSSSLHAQSPSSSS